MISHVYNSSKKHNILWLIQSTFNKSGLCGLLCEQVRCKEGDSKCEEKSNEYFKNALFFLHHIG